MTPNDTEQPAGEAAIKELRRRLAEVDGELNELLEKQRATERHVEEKQAERDALELAIKSLGGEATAREGARPGGRVFEWRYRDKPTIRILAIRRAEEGGGVLRIRELLRETRSFGFKSDQGGLHTYLKGLAEFEQSGPGEFTLRVDLGADGKR